MQLSGINLIKYWRLTMKKAFGKKLNLNKKTIVLLSKREMQETQGGKKPVLRATILCPTLDVEVCS